MGQPRGQKRWACTICATGSGSSSQLVPPQVMASTKAWTGFPAHFPARSERAASWKSARVLVVPKAACTHPSFGKAPCDLDPEPGAAHLIRNHCSDELIADRGC